MDTSLFYRFVLTNVSGVPPASALTASGYAGKNMLKKNILCIAS